MTDAKTLFQNLGAIAFGALFIVLGGVIQEARDDAIAAVDPLKARIVASGVSRQEISRPEGGTQIVHAPAIRFEYDVDGQTYSSDRLRPASEPLGERAWAEDFASDYPEGATVTVWYDRNAPGDAFLEKGRPWLAWFARAFGAAFVVIGLVQLLRAMRR